jgi:hypothetical protein
MCKRSIAPEALANVDQWRCMMEEAGELVRLASVEVFEAVPASAMDSTRNGKIADPARAPWQAFRSGQ